MRADVRLLALASVLGANSCGPSTQVQRRSVEEAIDLSGRWNDTDSRLVADEMTRDCLSQPWLENYLRKAQGQSPNVIVGTVVNRSHEHINVETFVRDIEQALVRSGRVSFVASRRERQELREERLDIAANASDRTMKGPGQETGADYMLKGAINTVLDELDGQRLIYYQINLELIDLATSQKVWINAKKIKKVITRARATW